MTPRTRSALAIALLAAGALALWHHKADAPGSVDAVERGPSTIERGIAYLVSQRARVPQHSLFVPAHIGRRYGYSELATFAEGFDPQSAAFAKQPVVNRMMAYAYDGAARVEALELEGQHPIARLLYPALHCDYLALPGGYGGRIEAAAGAGGYDATHAALALGFLRERGCALPRAGQLRAAVIEAMDRELRAAEKADDLSMELCAMLAYAGAHERIEPRWSAVVGAAQRDDGGWGYANAATSDWHHTTVALLCLLALELPDRAAAPMLPGAG